MNNENAWIGTKQWYPDTLIAIFSKFQWICCLQILNENHLHPRQNLSFCSPVFQMATLPFNTYLIRGDIFIVLKSMIDNMRGGGGPHLKGKWSSQSGREGSKNEWFEDTSVCDWLEAIERGWKDWFIWSMPPWLLWTPTALDVFVEGKQPGE